VTLILAVVVVAVVAGIVGGGSVRALEHTRIHWWGLGIAGLALQAAPVASLPQVPARVAVPLLLVSYALLMVVILLNRRLPASSAIALGLALNVAVIGANAGMPVSPDAIRAAGGSAAPPGVRLDAKRHVMEEGDVIAILGDVIPIPPPIAVVVSVGDLLLYGGLAWLVFQAMRGRGRPSPRPLALWLLAYRGKHAPDHWRLSSRVRTRDPS
jgi:hypothetical protein